MASITKLPSGAYRVEIILKGRYVSEMYLRCLLPRYPSLDPPGGDPGGSRTGAE